ncbi:MULTISPECIES: antibiotic biosynthesis monooxygenase family protein [Rhizobium/Agrobacterium group]|uniref:antibiotic biosynthesis monooxygenase family protein n=1 Tax=Rhizobium/Agrobacterium group TaxID=227290 RepID=UPI0006187406|nr:MULTISPECIES: antibiotic biosynthesis monooxygenase family protein [Rhizobium/Agrobacterium group]AKC10538.1 hypothetical protein Ach5_47710 [Agrobacterium tumefaciens]AYM19687.1 hypothetical protein At15955_47020 [Agrobacterium tumefaciens]AYM70989.1 hypothetical protein AtA6_47730 [Agrobacterium tumefaciens]
MIGMMVELRVAPGSTDAFERAFAVQAAAVRANEPRTRLYELFKSRTVADSYTLIEIYERRGRSLCASYIVAHGDKSTVDRTVPRRTASHAHIRDVADHGAHVAASRCQRRLHPLGTGRRRTSVWDLHEDNVNPCYCFRQAS